LKRDHRLIFKLLADIRTLTCKDCTSNVTLDSSTLDWFIAKAANIDRQWKAVLSRGLSDTENR